MARTAKNLESLPRTVPVFPLAGALLLPGGQLPLNIFEPRYLKMVDDALKAERLIAMVQPESPSQAQQATPRLAEVGCLGRLTQFAETRDGRYLITLSGLIRFRKLSEISASTPYRQCEVDYQGFLGDFDPDAGVDRVDREALLRSFRSFVEKRNLAVDWDSVHAAPTGALVNALATVAPFGLMEKQALLEAPDVAARAAVLMAAAEIELARDGGASPLQ